MSFECLTPLMRVEYIKMISV